MFSFRVLGGLLCAFSLISVPVSAQQASAVTKDSAGLATAQRALAAMGAASSVADTLCTGTLTLAMQQNQSLPITMKSKGTQLVRTELNSEKGLIIRVVNHGVGMITNPDGSVRKLLLNNTLAERVAHIPALSLLSEAQTPQIKVESLDGVQVNGVANNVFALGYTPDPLHPQASIFMAMTKTLFL